MPAAFAGFHDAVYRFVDAAIAAGDNQLGRAVAYGFEYLVFEIADADALVHNSVYPRRLHQLQDARQAPFRPAAAGNRVQE